MALIFIEVLIVFIVSSF